MLMAVTDDHQLRPAALGLTPGSELDPAVRAFRVVLALAQVLRSRMDERLRPDDLTTMQAAALTAVVHLDRPTASELAAALGTTRQNVAQLVRALERKGMIGTSVDPGDRRRHRLTATTRAETYWTGRDDGDLLAVRSWFAALDDAELGRLTDLASRVLGDLTTD